MKPSLGRIVHYQLSESDAAAITKDRKDRGGTGNFAVAGQVYPAMIVRNFGGTAVNLQVFLDGSDTYWATSRNEGEGDCTWSWPPRV